MSSTILGQEAGPHSDIYATGGIAFRMLTNRLPFVGPTGISVLTQKMDRPPPHAREVDPAVAPELDALVHEMMAVVPAERPSLREARARFGAFLKRFELGVIPSLAAGEEPRRPTTFHQFDDQAATRRAPVVTQLDALPEPAMSPPSRKTDVELRFAIPPTDLEHAFVPDGAARRPSWLLRAALLLGSLGGAGAAAWWLTHR